MTDLAEEAAGESVADNETIESLDSVLNGEPEAVKAKEPEPETEEPEGEETEAEPETEEPEDKEPSPPDGEDEDKSVPYAALRDERRRRQDAEEELRKYREGNKEQEPENSGSAVPDPVEDPEGYAEYLDRRNNETVVNTKVSVSRDIIMATSGYEDYEAMEKEFISMTNDNPHLIIQMRAASNPAKFAYDAAKDNLEFKAFKELKKSGGLKPKAEEVKDEAPEKPETVNTVPDLTKATSAKSGLKDKEEGLEDILGR